MKLRSLHSNSRTISFGQALRLVAEMEADDPLSITDELIFLKEHRTGRYWSLEGNRVLIHFLKKLAKLASGTIEMKQLREMSPKVYPDLRSRKVTRKSKKQAVVFLCRQQDEYSQLVPSLDSRDFWGQLEKAFPGT